MYNTATRSSAEMENRCGRGIESVKRPLTRTHLGYVHPIRMKRNEPLRCPLFDSLAGGLATDLTVGVNLSLAAALSPPPELYPSLPNCCGRGVIFFLNLLGADERAWDEPVPVGSYEESERGRGAPEETWLLTSLALE